MSTNAIAKAADDNDSGNEEPSSRPVKRSGGGGPPASSSDGPSFFRIYKKGQGKWTRLGTGVAAAPIGLLTAYNMWVLIPVFNVSRGTTGGIVAAFCIGYALLIFYLTNKPRNVDFLIATDSEMKKVNWTTQGALMGSTRVVIIFLVAIALFLFLADQVLQLFFWAIGVIKIEPWFVDSLKHLFHH